MIVLVSFYSPNAPHLPWFWRTSDNLENQFVVACSYALWRHFEVCHDTASSEFIVGFSFFNDISWWGFSACYCTRRSQLMSPTGIASYGACASLISNNVFFSIHFGAAESLLIATLCSYLSKHFTFSQSVTSAAVVMQLYDMSFLCVELFLFRPRFIPRRT